MAQLQLSCPDSASTTGAYALRWSWSEGSAASRFVVEENGAPIYRGADLATTVSGRSAGEYVYRVGLESGAEAPRWLSSCTVAVQPPTMTTAFSFFATGLVVFLATLFVIVRGHRAHRARGSTTGTST